MLHTLLTDATQLFLHKRIKKIIVGTTTGQKYEEVHFVDSTKPVWNYSLFTDEDIRNFQEGTHYSIYELMGSHRATVLGTEGYYFAVWAPNATAVSVIGNFNSWAPDTHPLFVRLDRSGIWEGFIPHFKTGEAYKYHIRGYKGGTLDKGDPYAYFWEMRPQTASITWELDYDWQDKEWMGSRKRIIRWRRPGVSMRCTWRAGCAQTKMTKKRYNTYDRCVSCWCPMSKRWALRMWN
jgi:1,4-alpha-glucan branching enzyme